MMDNRDRAESVLGNYLLWPLFTSLLMIIMTLIVYCFNKKIAVVNAVFTILMIVLLIYIYLRERKSILGNIIKFSMESNNSMISLFKDMDIPYMIIEEDGHILWKNKALSEKLGEFVKKTNNISFIFQGINIREIIAGYGKDYYE